MHPFKLVADLRPHVPYSIYSVPVTMPRRGPKSTAHLVPADVKKLHLRFGPDAQVSLTERPLNLDGPAQHRFAVLWDEDNDERVLAAIAAFYFAAPHEFRFAHCYGERKAVLTVWQLGFADEVVKTIRAAIDASPAISDWWEVEPCESYLPEPGTSLIPPYIMNAEIDPQLAALHALYTLGSFGAARPWEW